MRLSLRTLLAFEDNIFDVEQHRRLEQLLPDDKDAEATLKRLRSVVRNSSLGVPGLVDHQEELDPNYVAEYLDHQMPASVQEQFEAYCLSADKYLAEIASVHHILSNVLGEPARTSRECRLKCYDALGTKKGTQEPNPLASSSQTQRQHFRPEIAVQESPTHFAGAPLAQSPVAQSPCPFWKRWFTKQSKEPATQGMTAPGREPEQPKSSLWTFTILGLCICALLLAWQQIEKKRLAQQLREAVETRSVIAENSVSEEESPEEESQNQFSSAAQPYNVAEQTVFPPLTEPHLIAQTGYTEETFPLSAPPVADSLANSVADPFATGPFATDPFAAIPHAPLSSSEPAPQSAFAANNGAASNAETGDSLISPPMSSSPQSSPFLSRPEDAVVAFQPVTSSAKIPADVPLRQNPRPPIPATAWQPSEESSGNLRAAPEPTSLASTSLASTPHSPPSPPPQPIRQTSGTVPHTLGRAVPMTQPSVLFTAASLRDPWQLPPLPFDVTGEQYLLTAAPFRGMFELAGTFRIEMIGDAKICVLPPDAMGVPGIFVDYGLLVIHPLQANQSLRIETEKSGGIVTMPGTDSLLFVDTFAEIADPPGKVKPPEEQKAKRSPILGFVPKNGDRITWKSYKQPQPFSVDSLGSVLLQSDQYRLCEIRNLPNWLGPMPMSQDDRLLAEMCRRCFVDAGGNGEKALTQMIQDESRSARTLGLRLWGDLGRFDVPLSVMTAKRPEDEAIRIVLGRYFKEVMLRDAETVQRFADAIDAVKEQMASRSEE